MDSGYQPGNDMCAGCSAVLVRAAAQRSGVISNAVRCDLHGSWRELSGQFLIHAGPAVHWHHEISVKQTRVECPSVGHRILRGSRVLPAVERWTRCCPDSMEFCSGCGSQPARGDTTGQTSFRTSHPANWVRHPLSQQAYSGVDLRGACVKPRWIGEVEGCGSWSQKEHGHLHILRVLPDWGMPEYSPGISCPESHGVYAAPRPGAAKQFRKGLGGERLSRHQQAGYTTIKGPCFHGCTISDCPVMSFG